MDINNVALIIVTAFINLAVSSFIFYRYQKKIDISFAKQLEEFRINLQNSSFERQTIYSRSHQRMMETLDAICQEYSELSHSTLTNLICLADSFRKNDTEQPDKVITQELRNRLNEFDKMLTINRHYLPEYIADEIGRISFRTTLLVTLADLSVTKKKDDVLGESESKRFDNVIRGFDFDINPIKANDNQLITFFTELFAQLQKEAKFVENVYRTVAEARPVEGN